MYDINVYQYETKPFNYSGKYGILPLNEKGLHKYYLGKNTHTRKYLNKFNPIILQDDKEEEVKKTVTLEPINKDIKKNYAMNVSKSTPSLNMKENKKKKGVKAFSRNLDSVYKITNQKTDNGQSLKNNRVNGYPLNLKYTGLRTDNYRSQKNIFRRNYSTTSPREYMHKNQESSPLKYYTEGLAKSIMDTMSSNDDKVKKENMVLKTMLDEQSDINFLKKTKLPDIIKVKNDNSEKVIRRINLGHCKYLSEKYEPLSLCFSLKSHTGRNFVGAKFQY